MKILNSFFRKLHKKLKNKNLYFIFKNNLFNNGYLIKKEFQMLEPFDRIQRNIEDEVRIGMLGKYKNHPNNDMDTSQYCPVLELPLGPSRV